MAILHVRIWHIFCAFRELSICRIQKSVEWVEFLRLCVSFCLMVLGIHSNNFRKHSELHQLRQTIKPREENSSEPPPSLPPRFLELLSRTAKIKATWEGARSDLEDQSGSGYDMAMANHLVHHGFTDDETKSIFRSMLSGRGAKVKDECYTRTIGKARSASHGARLPAADAADQYLVDRQFDSPDGLHYRWYREGWLRYDGMVYHPFSKIDLQADVTGYLQGHEARERTTNTLVTRKTDFFEFCFRTARSKTEVCVLSTENRSTSWRRE